MNELKEELEMDNVNLNDYKKSMFIYGKTEEELIKQLKEYEECASGGDKKATIKLRYCTIDKDWIYIDFVYAKDFGEMNFWHYQNLLLWLAEGESSKSFCFAYKEFKTYEDAFYSHANIEDEMGASVTGIYKGAEFLYEVPGFYIDWWSDEGDCNLNSDTLYRYRKIDESLLENIQESKWNEIEIVVSD